MIFRTTSLLVERAVSRWPDRREHLRALNFAAFFQTPFIVLEFSFAAMRSDSARSLSFIFSDLPWISSELDSTALIITKPLPPNSTLSCPRVMKSRDPNIPPMFLLSEFSGRRSQDRKFAPIYTAHFPIYMSAMMAP